MFKIYTNLSENLSVGKCDDGKFGVGKSVSENSRSENLLSEKSSDTVMFIRYNNKNWPRVQNFTSVEATEQQLLEHDASVLNNYKIRRTAVKCVFHVFVIN